MKLSECYGEIRSFKAESEDDLTEEDEQLFGGRGRAVIRWRAVHCLRHTFSTRLADHGVHDAAIMALLGHSSIRMSRIYTHAAPEAMQDAINRLGRAGDVLEFRVKRADVRHNSANKESAAVGA